MNTLDNGIDRILAKAANEAVNADAALLEGFADTQLPKDVSLRAAATVKTGKHRTSFGRLYKKAVGVAAALIAVISLAYTVNTYATYEPQEIWGIDIIDNGNSFNVIINSTVASPNTIEKVGEITALPEGYTKSEVFSNIAKHVYDYYENETLVLSLSQSSSTPRETNVDDDCTFQEIWIKGNKAVFINYNQTGNTGIFWFDGEYTYSLHSYKGEDVSILTQLANSVK